MACISVEDDSEGDAELIRVKSGWGEIKYHFKAIIVKGQHVTSHDFGDMLEIGER